MKTLCPDCGTRFDVTSAQLNVRNGKVRCGVCSTVFNAFDHAVADEPDFPVLQTTAAQSRKVDVHSLPETGYHEPVRKRQADPEIRRASGRPGQEQAEPFMGRNTVPSPVESDEFEPRMQADGRNPMAGERFVTDNPSLSGSGAYSQGDRDANPRQVSVEGQYRRRVQLDTEYDDPEHSNGSGLIWFLAVLFALIVLFAQGAIVFRNQVASIAPTLRPKLVQLCSFVGCQVGYTRSVRNLAILKPVLRQTNSPSAAQETRSFRMQAVIRNNDSIAQPWPSLVLSLKDASESVSARRIIKPEEYLLPDAQKRTFQPKDEVAIDLPVVASRTDVAGFELSLFYP